MKYFIGMCIGWLMCAITLALFWAEPWANRDRQEMELRYDAYRLCIPKPGCMTAEDYIDYYDLKWRLENDRND